MNLFSLPEVGQKLLHKPTGRPVEVAAVTEDYFDVHTLDDVYPHPKTGKNWGGCRWRLPLDKWGQFESR